MRKAIVLLAVVLAVPLMAADLRTIGDPAKVGTVFSKSARVRVLNIWATWCVPCVAEMEDLRAIDETFDASVAMAGVSLDDMLPDAKKERVALFLDQKKIRFPNVYYTGNADALGDHLNFRGEIPVTILYDRKGKELWRHQGVIQRDEVIARIREALRRNP